jgi:hypothetical protein
VPDAKSNTVGVERGMTPPLDTLVEKLWGFSPSKLTPEGLSKLINDVMAMGISGFLLMNYPLELSPDLTIRWAGAVVLLLLMLYAFFPQMVRVMMGNYYNHYVEEGEE